MQRVLIVLKSHTQLGDTGRDTGFYFDELATPYWAMSDAGYEVDIASIAGGPTQHDPSSVQPDVDQRPMAVSRFEDDVSAMSKVTGSMAIEDVDADQYAAVFLPGGHGTMYDFPQSEALAKVVSTVHANDGIVDAVCHGPAGLLTAKRVDGEPLVKGIRINAFKDAEEAAAGLTDTMPFLLETRLRSFGAIFESTDNFQSHAVRGGRFVTGQNPASVDAVATHLIAALSDRDSIAA